MKKTPTLTQLADTLRGICGELSVLSAALKDRRQAAPAQTARRSARRIREVIQVLEQRARDR